MFWLRDLIRLAAWFPGLSLGAVVFSFLAALLEGVGLAALIPVMQGALGATTVEIGPLFGLLPTDRTAWIPIGLLTFAILSGLAAISRFLADSLQLRLRAAIEKRARSRLTHALLAMSWPAFTALRHGDISQAQFTEGIQMGTGAQMLVQATGALLASAAYVAVALAISPRLTAYALAFGILVALLYTWIGRGGQKHADALSGIAIAIGERLADLFQAVKFARATGLAPQAEQDANSLYEDWRRRYVASQTHPFAMRVGFELLGLAFIAVFLALSTGSQEGIASALVFLGVFYRLAPRLLAVQEGLFHARSSHSWYLSWSGRIASAEAAAEPDSGGATPSFSTAIKLRDVSFGYPGATKPTLSGVSLTIGAGASVAIVGPSGSGKSTLLDLLTGLLHPTEGTVLIDGRDLRDIDIGRWRRQLGVMLQEPLIVAGDFLRNICWGADRQDSTRAHEAARQAGLLDVIDATADGLAADLGDKGSRLSGGQRQRLALARALYRSPTLLILDEPTSALDEASQQEVISSLRRIKGGCTMVVVTHSPAVAALCDAAYRLRDGCLTPVTFADPGDY